MAKKIMYPTDEEIKQVAEKIFFLETTKSSLRAEPFSKPKLYGFKIGAKWAIAIMKKRREVNNIKNK